MKRALLIGMILTFAVGCTTQRNQGEFYTKAEIDSIVKGLNSRISNAARESDPVWNAHKDDYLTRRELSEVYQMLQIWQSEATRDGR